MKDNAFFKIGDIEFFSKRVLNNQRYKNNEIQDLGDSQRIIEGIYEKTTEWGESVKKKYKKLFKFEPDNRWQISGYFKKYTWGRLYINGHGNQDIYYTLGVDSESMSLVVKIDFNRVGSKILTKFWIDYFDDLLRANNIEWKVIGVEELKGKDKEWLIDETCKYIDSTIHIYKELYRVLFNKILVQSDSVMETSITNQPLNQILYGPPGTGKTYSTVEYAYKIIKGNDAFETDGYEKAKLWFKEELAKADSDDRQLDFITFHQNYSYEDFVMGIKPDLNEGDGLSFTRHEGIFYKICQRTLKNYEDSQKPIEVIKQEKGLEELFEGFKDFISEKIEDSELGRFDVSKSAYVNKIDEDAFVYTGDNWNQKGRMKFDDILKIYQNIYATNRKAAKFTTNISRTAYEHMSYYYKMVETLREFKNKQKNESVVAEKVKLKNYVIIIDEINRANISRVFGELITLIEDDKRWGNDHAMEVRLPDGHTKFTVPKNLYIIGTMNTADKSIALLDIALRRRFEFTAKYPDSEKVNEKYKDFFEALNKDIIAKQGIDFTIGHSYFMTKPHEELDFVKTMNKKVIPLLCEYFYNPKDNKAVVKLIQDAITKAGLLHEIDFNDYQICIK